MAGGNGPWGGGGGSGGDDRDPDRDGGRRPSGNRRPGETGPLPEIDDLVRKGQEQLRVLMGGRGGGNGRGPAGGGNSGVQGPKVTRQGVALGALMAVGLWSWASFYTLKPEERSVELFLGKFQAVGEPGLNFAPWPLVTAEIVPVTREQTTDIGTDAPNAEDTGLMLTRDQNIVDIEFQVVWNVTDPAKYLFNLADPADTIRAVSESAMRDIMARSELAPVLNTDRGAIQQDLKQAIQSTLDSYGAGVNIVRVIFDRADPPAEVIDSFRQVQAARQERDRLQNEAQAYANKVTAGARGQAAQIKEDAEAYRAQAVNAAEGETSRFLAVYGEYLKAPEVTRQRMYLETMERVLGPMNKVLMEGVGGEGGQGVVPYLPLPGVAAKPAAGGSN